MRDGEGLFEAEPVEKKRPRVRAAAVDKRLRAFDPLQALLLPPSLDDWLPEDHLARFVADLVDQALDLAPILADYTEKRGYPPYDPRLMVRLLLIYGYTTGVRSSRAIGMVKMGRVALDGTELEANASRHKAMSYGRLVDKEECVEAEIAELEATAAALLANAEHVDTAEDARFGVDGKEVDLPAELSRREKRLARLQAARAQIEAEAAAKARRHAEDKERRRQRRAGKSDEQAVTDVGTAGLAAVIA